MAERKPTRRTDGQSRNMKSLLVILITGLVFGPSMQTQNRPRARELGINVGILPTGSLNAITDVPGVMVGHTTLIRGDNVRTGVTAILPHGGNLFQEKVPGAVFVRHRFWQTCRLNPGQRARRDRNADTPDLHVERASSRRLPHRLHAIATPKR